MKRITDTITFIEGPFFQFPYCHCVLVQDDRCCFLDTAMPASHLLEIIEEKQVDVVLYTHGHLDHVYNRNRIHKPFYLYPMEEMWMESEQKFLEAFGFSSSEEKVFGKLMMQAGEWSSGKPDGHLFPGQVIDLGKNRIQVLPLPGHTPGHCGFFFLDEGILYSGDIDLTDFGPFYGNPVSSIEDFISSLEFLIELQPDMILAGHGEGIVKRNVRQRLRDYRDIIFKREDDLVANLKRFGKATLNEIVSWKTIYGKYNYPEEYEALYRVIERNMDVKHLERLIAQGRVVKDNEYYVVT
ncbi:MAG: MBL fold metallo-hydrolase [Syntrophothermus sp.]|uniref:MBL fold metallo-hydrolase n=1 Tax=Syntrophothermus sp. TaxID=2736299 RepID=UPI0025806C4F|nr:MBL fold metallo-hydrolase [Syntrophothermus sp.]NSW84060.1 MBL fold metallo-hydrolase [Syntrophothermus sp.]